MNEDSEAEMVSVFYAREIYCYCPHCSERIDGWWGDPRGEETTCEYCGKAFNIHNDADVEFE